MKTSRQIFLCAACACVLIAGGVVGFWRPGLLRGQSNDGHQLGGDLLAEVPGNTIAAFKIGIRDYEASPEWKYSECDVRETIDNRLVLFHDWDLSNIPDSEFNRSVVGEPVGGRPINELTLDQLQTLQLLGDHRIPTLEEMLQTAAEIGPVKPILLEIKLLHSDTARERMIELAMQYRDEHDLEIHFLAFIRNVNRSFPEPQHWLDRISDAGFRVYQVYRPKVAEYDLCETWND